jgi:hypothetical protein
VDDVSHGGDGRSQARRRSGLTKDQWRDGAAPYIRDVIARDAYPQFARLVREAEDADPGQRFDFGLACVLDGIAARVHRPWYSAS